MTPEKLPSVWELLDERDKLRKEILELKENLKQQNVKHAMEYLSLMTQNDLLYDENCFLKSTKKEVNSN